MTMEFADHDETVMVPTVAASTRRKTDEQLFEEALLRGDFDGERWAEREKAALTSSRLEALGVDTEANEDDIKRDANGCNCDVDYQCFHLECREHNDRQASQWRRS